MCIIIKRGGHGSHQYRIRKIPNQKYNPILRRQGGFTLPEMLVSLCILGIVMHSVGQWGTVLYRTSDTMAQNQQAIYMAQQLYAGLSPECPEGWDVSVTSIRSAGLLYETTIQIQTNHRLWQFYYVGPEAVVYEVAANSS